MAEVVEAMVTAAVLLPLENVKGKLIALEEQ